MKHKIKHKMACRYNFVYAKSEDKAWIAAYTRITNEVMDNIFHATYAELSGQDIKNTIYNTIADIYDNPEERT